MSEKGSEKGRNSFWLVGLALPVMLVLYVLSVGPVAMVVRPNGPGSQVAEVVYAPLGWLHDHTALREPLDAYIDFWRR